MRKAIVLLLVLVLASVATAGTLTLSDLLLRTRAYWGEYNSANSNWPDSVLTPIINDAEAMVAHVAKCIERDTTIVFVENQENYALPSDYDGHIGVKRYGKTTNPANLLFVSYDQYSRMPKQEGAQPDHFSIADDEIFIWPVPEEDEKDSIRVIYYAYASGMSAGSDTCDVKKYWQGIIPMVAKDLIGLKDQPASDVLTKVRGEITAWRRDHQSVAAPASQ